MFNYLILISNFFLHTILEKIFIINEFHEYLKYLFHKFLISIINVNKTIIII